MNKIKDKKILLLVLGIMSFSFGIWTNYRQLWLKSIGFNVISISRIFSVSLICSSIIIFIISFFSNKIRLRNVLTLSLFLRTISLLTLIISKNNYLIKCSILLCVMCENIFSLSYYPLLSLVDSSNELYKKHVNINFIAKDAAVAFCAFMLGVTTGKYTFNYNTCLYIVFLCTLLSTVLMLFFKEHKITKKKKTDKFINSIKEIFKNKIINYYLLAQFINDIAYNIIFGMFLLLLTEYLNIDINYASIFVIICSVSGTLTASILSKISDKFSLNFCYFLKYGIRVIIYLIALILNIKIIYIICIFIAYITTKILDDRVNGTFIRSIEDNSRFLFGNIKYFIICIADGIGLFLAGIFLNISLIYVFLSAFIFTLIATLIYIKYTN